MPQLAGVTHHWVDAGGLQLHVAEAGSGHPVVLLHGWPQHWYCWRGVIPLLAHERRVLAPDLRGFGWSDAPADGYDKRRLGADVLAALDELGVETFTLAGHDWGGMIAFLLALDHPQRVERLVAMNSGHPWMRPGARELASAFLRIAPYQSLISAPLVGSTFIRRAMVPLTEHAMRSTGSWHEDAARSFREQFDDQARVDASVQLYRTWLVQELPRLRSELRGRELMVPSVYLHGEGDPVLRPALVRSGIDHVRHLDFELVPEAGHFLPEDAPALVADRILRG